ncbi:hypothetical protein AHF37_03194 [Paragonimus kellicotti]|nr:hypothetical protein AHF37_03194 [Paragonimus kellicotti]
MIQTPSQFQVLKTCILDVHENHIDKIRDDQSLLRVLCEAVERAFRLGFHAGFRVRDYWCWMESLIQICRNERSFIHPSYEDSIKMVHESRSVTTSQGRGRLLIRILLQRGLLDVPVKFMQTHADYATKFYEPSYSALGNEIFVQIFCSLVSEVCRLPFQLNLDNAEFLDETWQMPVFKQLEFVPCFKLGASLDLMDGHVVVMDLDPAGVAAEDNQIELGDILVTMYGKALRGSFSKIASLRNTHEGQPVPLGVQKARLADGDVYPPLKTLLMKFRADQLISFLNIDNKNLNCIATSGSSRSFFEANPNCRLLFVGQCDIGSDGSVRMINRSILQVLMKRRPSEQLIPVHMELGEIGITVWEVQPKTGELVSQDQPLFRHSYPQIASCGRRTDGTNFLAYIVGQEACTICTSFRCLVFEAVNQNESRSLINEIAHGFDRTHWTL